MKSHVLAALVSERYVRYFVLYILRLRFLAISNTYKYSSCFSSKTEIFQNDVEYFPKMSFLTLLLFFSLVVTKENCFENFLRSLYKEQNVLFVQMQSRVSAALVFERYVRYFGSLHPAFEMSAIPKTYKNSF